MSATCPGRLSVGTRVWLIPNAPRSSVMVLKNGATILGDSVICGNGFTLKSKSALNPSPKILQYQS